MDLEKVSKEQMSQRNFDKWAKYNMKITQDVFKKLQQFESIKNPKGHYKAFRLKKNGQNNGIFTEIPARLDNILKENGNILNEQNQNVDDDGGKAHENNERNNVNNENRQDVQNDNEMNINYNLINIPIY